MAFTLFASKKRYKIHGEGDTFELTLTSCSGNGAIFAYLTLLKKPYQLKNIARFQPFALYGTRLSNVLVTGSNIFYRYLHISSVMDRVG